MEYVKGQVLVSAAGHDKGDLFAVTGSDGKRVFLTDGKSRKLEKPKAKNPKHVRKTQYVLSEHSMATNRSIRKQLNKIANPGG
ncbi:MAG: KOW domain-containing RNA-binding protein [Clostridia bacterium]|nr:KOW domain-containing RNA-binding protein [Clostridia bacterium]